MPKYPLRPTPREVADLASGLSARAAAAGHRALLVLSGERCWCRAVAGAVAEREDGGLWVGDTPPPGWAPGQVEMAGRLVRLLGSERPLIVFDAFAGFDPDGFGAAAGSLCAGGLLLLLVPSLEQWPDYPDPEHERLAVANFDRSEVTGRFLRRLASIVAGSSEVVRVVQGAALPPLPSAPPRGERCRGEGACRTADQALAVGAVVKAATGHRRRPVVLVADRGRGKSAALGIAAAQLLSSRPERIVVTAPWPEAAAAVFEQAARLLPQAEAEPFRLTLDGGVLTFAPPDELVRSPRPFDLLLVDEAAAIPTSLLTRLLAGHSRVAFATTVHGYEGTGQGFAVRFHRELDRLTPGWKLLRLEEPVRWAPGDPLERFTFKALLLDAAPAPDLAVAGASARSCTIELVDRDRLAKDERMLRELFGLLVLAHYRTTPLDLRHLLDGPNLTLWVMRHHGSVVATALVAREGGFDPLLAQAIWEGRRRPRGHLIPQSLAAHGGLREAPSLRCDRVVRIAVHPTVQGRGLGRLLSGRVIDQARQDGVDLVGASFGATSGLVAFWRGAGFAPVRLGMSRESSSGAHPLIVLAPLTASGKALFKTARLRFVSQLPHLLGGPLSELDPEMVPLLIRGNGHWDGPKLDRQDWLDILAFAFALRGYEFALVPLWKLTVKALAAREEPMLSREEENALVLKLLQRRSWSETADALGLHGKRQVTAFLRRAFQKLVGQFGEPWLQLEVTRLTGRR